MKNARIDLMTVMAVDDGLEARIELATMDSAVMMRADFVDRALSNRQAAFAASAQRVGGILACCKIQQTISRMLQLRLSTTPS